MAEPELKKVLIITYYWPPSGGSGVQRWLKMVKYLRNYGWEPIIYTPENPEYPEIDESLLKDIPEGIEVIKRPIWEPYTFYKKLVGLKKQDKISAGFLTEKKKIGITEKFSVWVRGNFFIPDARKFWIKPSIKYLLGYLENNTVDAIVSTGPPHSMHLIALGLQKKTKIPWLADFRDPWTGIDFYADLRLSRSANSRHRVLEKAVLMNADAIVVISQNMEKEFKIIFETKYSIITNGFDTEDILINNPDNHLQKFTLAHIGSIPSNRNPKILWIVISKMIHDHPEFESLLEIKLVGKVDYSVLESINQAGLNKFLSISEYVPHDKVINEMQKSQVLLLLINQTPKSEGILTGKLFEYLAAKRPIICIGPVDGDASKILEETRSGKTVGFEDSEKLEAIIFKYFHDFVNQHSFKPSTTIKQYSREQLTGRVAELLNTICR
jgi:hypothetical protein